MAQVNARVPDELEPEFTQWAKELKVERGRLAKDLIAEALAARREGRAMFEKPVTLGPGDMIAMQATLERGVMEIDRIATVWAKHEADIRKQERDNQQMRTQVQGEIIADLPARISKSLNPIRQEMLAMAERIDKQPRLDTIDAGQRELTAALEANTTAIERLEEQPRHVTGLILGDDWFWSTAFVVLWTVMTIFVAIAPITIFERAFPGVGIFIADKIVSGDAGFCRLVNNRFGGDGCQVPRDHQGTSVSGKTPVTATADPKAIQKTASHAMHKAKRS
ncbi:hypothetical protein KZX46_20985 (plasmid) [Polymorphobacter sp. PAMC 29334]|uniref:hypothetical protein n=1 Tax=Polymorphobacter sp. PAMC 29334 TaxID=2862331 RepID=UPI001C787C04|nr:hypothetical protein [Polymorphobacter sp. PAMC 29334]QYE37034.1 hypothetical protein KZX46_20985 [Polymorphobacter sp. PAMC 29334]